MNSPARKLPYRPITARTLQLVFDRVYWKSIQNPGQLTLSGDLDVIILTVVELNLAGAVIITEEIEGRVHISAFEIASVAEIRCKSLVANPGSLQCGSLVIADEVFQRFI